MSAPDQVLRPPGSPLKARIMQAVLAAAPFAFRVLRRLRPILRFGSIYVVSRHDDVREVFASDAAFGVPYKKNLDVITGGEPFFLGMSDGLPYQTALNAMMQVMGRGDLPMLASRAEALARVALAKAEGRIDVVADLLRPATFRLFSEYLGLPDPATGRLDVWATRLFEFQFAGSPNDHALRAEVDAMAPAFRAHVDAVIARRKAGGPGPDDVLGRCLALQAKGEPGFSDIQIRTALLCMMVGGPPQPPMVVPQAMEQLLRRPEALEAAQLAARTGDDAALAAMVREAMRFDPLAPGLPRVALKDSVLARGTRRETLIPKDATVIAAFASAMMDGRRVPAPDRFDANRRPHEYLHFGHGLHECFGRHINGAILHLFLKPLLAKSNLRRAPGSMVYLRKNGIFAESLYVDFDPD